MNWIRNLISAGKYVARIPHISVFAAVHGLISHHLAASCQNFEAERQVATALADNHTSPKHISGNE